MTLNALADQAAAVFERKFGRSAEWRVAAPGRVNIIGEHTDYNDGFVLPMAIERWTVIAAAPAPGSRVTLHSDAISSKVVIDLTQPMRRGAPDWANYVRGVIAGFQQRNTRVEGFEGVLSSSVPLGSGLSSSAALEVATATLLEAATGHLLAPVEKALLCQEAEHKFAGVPCGIMDQFTSALARQDHLLLLDCRSRETELIPMSDPGVAVLVINSNIRHDLASGEYARRRTQCEKAAKELHVPALRDATMEMLGRAESGLDSVVFRRARHIITENLRTTAAARAIADSDWPVVGGLMYASHASLRDDYEVSCAELDTIVDLAHSIGIEGGVIGCRMTGGGFGGCAVALVQSDAVPRITQELGKRYAQEVGIEASMFVSRPAGGASILG